MSITWRPTSPAKCTKAVAFSNLGQKVNLKNTINDMVSQLNIFASEVTGVALEKMALNITTAVARGNLTKKVEIDVKGEILDLKSTINNMVSQLSIFASEVTLVMLEVGTKGKLGGQAKVEGVQGTWGALTDNVNTMAMNLTGQVRSISLVTKAVALGDLTQKVDINVKGEMLDLENTINGMVTQLHTLASEITRVSIAVGTEGKLGGQAMVEGTTGMWKTVTDNINLMAKKPDQPVMIVAHREILDLKNTVNGMTTSLSQFAAKVTRVAREVSTEGKLGGQAKVEGIQGTWKDLTDNVNVMANNLTLQVWTILDATNAVAKDDLTGSSQAYLSPERCCTCKIKVALEVGTKGNMGVQAEVGNMQGIWLEITILLTCLPAVALLNPSARSLPFGRLCLSPPACQKW
ncbi:hypothetical protein MVEN_01104300 [Mycena venus]|uniref:HAMP domain-containing protein n=1 Tax=Mycena venus TaxID=2733690 RepID=A0A8H6Y8L7_9AGAR|nr:hypothetical protein MVEN_01104300 [Mycena venus]